MIRITVLKGIPGSGKSSWAKEIVAKDPLNFLIVNNDQIRAMCNGSVWSQEYEVIISSTRGFLIREALKNDKHLIVDNLNIHKDNWTQITKIAKQINKDVTVEERPFYIDLETAVSRDALREGKAKVGREVIEKWWSKSGKEKFKDYQPKSEIFLKQNNISNRHIEPIKQDETLPRAVVFDNDGTISLIHSNRSPYDASSSHLDIPHSHVIECMKLYFNAGYKILFVSGREEKDREPTEQFYKKYFPEVEYELWMRPTGNMEKDVLIKERIFNEYIKDKYFLAGWFDDRLQIVKWLYNAGFPVFRVNDPEAIF